MAMFPLLVADIGGTNARFALAMGPDHGKVQIEVQRVYECSDYSSFDHVLRDYLEFLVSVYGNEFTLDKNIKHASIAIAGPINDHFAQMTNLDWTFSVNTIKKAFGFESVVFINDLAAHALATVQLDSSQFNSLKPGQIQAKATKAIIGPGTGLGVATLHWSADCWRAFPTEGGHVTFAPNNDIEREIQKILLAKFNYVSLEMLLSGPGLLNIYQSLAQINGQIIHFDNSKNILQNTIEDPLCLQSVAVFVGALGSAAGDLALAYGATGGLYLGGGMTKHLLPFIKSSDFTQRFLQTGFRKDYLSGIPIDAILHPCPGLLGAALWYHQHSQLHQPVFE